ncbi:MAG: cytochrome c oxidase subunit II [Cellvibrionaceae bacterium]
MLRRAKPLFHQLLGSAALMSIFSHQTFAEEAKRWGVNLTQGVTPVSHEIYDLHMLIFWICVVIGVVVFGAMIYTMFMHRKSRGHEASQFHEHLGLEAAWTIVPFVILVAMAFPATTALVKIYDTDSDVDLDVVVTGYQWKWKYEYLGKDVSFFSSLHPEHNEARQLDSGIDPFSVPNYLLEVDEPLILPIKQKIRFLITANDVLHAWFVPAFAVKKDAIPGFVNESWAYIEEPGVYRGQCAELCGKDHGFMPIVVKAVEQAEFDEWIGKKKEEAEKMAELAGQTFTFDQLYAQGEDVYNRACAACHGPTGEGVPGAFPAIKGSPVATGPVADHLKLIVKGVSGTAMQAFGEQLSPVDLAAVVTFQRNSWGNNMGDTVQPIDVLQVK